MTTMLTTGFIMGCMLILVGLITLINVIFNIHIPIFRILFAFLFMYLGVKMLMGSSRTERFYYSSSCTSQGICTEKNVIQYDVAFNKQVIDLTTVELPNKNSIIEINTSFGETIVLIDTTQPIQIDASSSFGTMELPNHFQVTFGSHVYQTPSCQTSSECINIRAKVVFGKCVIIDKKDYRPHA